MKQYARWRQTDPEASSNAKDWKVFISSSNHSPLKCLKGKDMQMNYLPKMILFIF